MSARRCALVATLVLASALVAACSGSGPAATAGTGGAGDNQPSGQHPAQQGNAAPSDLCSIWTADQVSAAVQGPAGSGTPQNDGKMCLWGDENTGANASISIDDGQGYAATCGAPGVVKVDGVGDGACFLVGGNLGTSLEFQKGGRSYSVAVQKVQVTVDWIEAAEKTLALEAMAKL